MTDQIQDSDTDAAEDSFIIGSFPPYFEREQMNQWSWIAVAVMIGNYRQTGRVVNGNIQKWTQAQVMTSCIGSANLNVPGSPDKSMNVTMVYSPLNSGNADINSSLPAIRAAIRTLAPVVVGWGTPQGDQLGNPRYIVVYGFEGTDKWYFADPGQQTVTKRAPLPIPNTGNLVTKVVYSRMPPPRMR